MELRIDGQAVRRLREAKLWTQEDLAEACRVHARTIQRVEAAGVGSAHTIRGIAEALGVEPRELDGEGLPAAATPGGEDLWAAVPWTGVAAAFIWVALACLVYVPTAPVGSNATIVAALGFTSLVVGLWCWNRRERAPKCPTPSR
jgi:transcriptional regulator with XRE-family HTH domain